LIRENDSAFGFKKLYELSLMDLFNNQTNDKMTAILQKEYYSQQRERRRFADSLHDYKIQV
jgi:hypothetical protein